MFGVRLSKEYSGATNCYEISQLGREMTGL